jgi:signal peptidase I
MMTETMLRTLTPEGIRVRLDVAVDSLRLSGSLRLRVTGGSMLPTIRPGSRVLIRRAAPNEIQCGDIVLLRADTGLRLHRLVSVLNAPDGALLITRGDNDMEDDPPVGAAQLLGLFGGIEQSPPKWRRLSWLLDSLFRHTEHA